MRRARRAKFGAVLRHPLTGRQFRVSAATQAQLEERRRAIDFVRDRFRAGEMTLAAAHDIVRSTRGLQRVTLARAADAYAAREALAENTRRAVRHLLTGPAFELAPIELNALDVKTMSRWVDHMRARQVAVTSISCYWRRLRAIAMYAVERDWIAALPWGPWSPKLVGRDPKVREACRDLDELGRLLWAARELDRIEGCARDLEAKITCGIALGLRQGELAGLRWTDLDEHESVVVIARQWSGALTKTKHRPKRLHVSPELFVVLGEHRKRLVSRQLYAPSGPIFPSSQSSPGKPRPYDKGECLTIRSLRSVVRLGGLPNENAWTAHSLRDSFATLEALGHGGDLATVAQRTRHKSLQALARYLHAVRRLIPSAGFTLPTRSDSIPLLGDGDRGATK